MKDRCWIIGSGPSLNSVDMSALRDETTIAFNRSYIAWDEWGWAPTYFVCIDLRVMRSIADDLNRMLATNEVCKPVFILRLGTLNGWLSTAAINAGTGTIWVPCLAGAGFNANWRAMYYCGDVAAFSLQVAYCLGYREAVLVGVDQNWPPRESVAIKNEEEWHGLSDDDVQHFRPDYYGTDQVFSDPCQEAHLRAWHTVLDAVGDKMNVINASPESALTERLGFTDYESILKGNVA